MVRLIFHVDLDAFFVAVERTLDPSLIGKPVITGGLGPRGVVTCASYEARPHGVRSAMPIAQARRLCPQAVFLPSHHSAYFRVSKRFMAILRDTSPVVEPVSIDEAYVDMTGTELLYGAPERSSAALRARIARELLITASIGAGPSRLSAKIASGACKPDGLLVLPEAQVAPFLAPLPVRRLPGIGPRAEQALKRLGVTTLGQLAAFPEGPLRRELGPRSAASLRARAAGVDHSPVGTRAGAKSISAETTFDEDRDEPEGLRGMLRSLSERVGSRLRSAGQRARSVTLKLRYHDFATITRQTTLAAPVDGNEAIYAAAAHLFDDAMGARHARVRLLGVGVRGLAEAAGQLSLLDSGELTDSALSTAVDSIRHRYGRHAIHRGSR